MNDMHSVDFDGWDVMGMENVVLIGMPGTGKSTVGAKLAKRLRYGLIDTDRLIVEKTGKTLPQILSENGVDGFIEVEGRIGVELRCEHCVIATGGSMVFSDAAMQNLREGSTVVWLDTSLAELERRIHRSADRGIAAAPGTNVAQIDAARRPLYQKYADIRVQTVGGVERVVALILDALDRKQKR